MCKGFAGIVGFKEGFLVGDATRNVFGKSRCCKEEMAVRFAVWAGVLLGETMGVGEMVIGQYRWWCVGGCVAMGGVLGRCL